MGADKKKVSGVSGELPEPETSTQQPENIHLNPALDGKFRIKGTHCPIILNTTVGDIDFRTLTEEQAEQLVLDGFPDGFVFLERLSS